MKSGENWSSGFREEDVRCLKISWFYGGGGGRAGGGRGGGGGGGGRGCKILILTKTFYYFNHTL